MYRQSNEFCQRSNLRWLDAFYQKALVNCRIKWIAILCNNVEMETKPTINKYTKRDVMTQLSETDVIFIYCFLTFLSFDTHHPIQ